MRENVQDKGFVFFPAVGRNEALSCDAASNSASAAFNVLQKWGGGGVEGQEKKKYANKALC